MQEDFVICPVDKAANNFGFVCKRLYREAMEKEVGNKDTFTEIQITKSAIVTSIYNKSKEFKLFPNRFKIPSFYGIPKFHKTPIKFRYISSTVGCINNDASHLMTDVLREMLSRINTDSWIIDNNHKILKDMDKINNMHSGLVANITLFSCDFGTLYTSLPHQSLKEVISNVFK